jgi:membrane-bound metal-dependent hydrolase YbcI (DUF457 family)
MAQFRTHIGLGVFLGVGVVVAGLIFALFSNAESAFWIFLAILAGSFLPDLDMDDGIPFQILFGLLGAGMAGLVFFNSFQEGERSLKVLILVPALVFMAVRFGAGYIFEKFTNHRGMFHSVPAAILFGLLTIWFLHLFSVLAGQELMIGAAVAIGYLGHLILDETYSAVNLHGHSIFPKTSLGNALKLSSSSQIATAFFYLLLFALAVTLPETRDFLRIN